MFKTKGGVQQKNCEKRKIPVIYHKNYSYPSYKWMKIK